MAYIRVADRKKAEKYKTHGPEHENVNAHTHDDPMYRGIDGDGEDGAYEAPSEAGPYRRQAVPSTPKQPPRTTVSAVEDPVAYLRRWFDGLQLKPHQLNGMIVAAVVISIIAYVCGKADESTHSTHFAMIGAFIAYSIVKSLYKRLV